MGFRNFGKTQLGKYSANINWEKAVKRSLLQGLVNALDLENHQESQQIKYKLINDINNIFRSRFWCRLHQLLQNS